MSGEYLTDRWSVRSEVLDKSTDDLAKDDAAYFEAAYHLTEHWQLAGRWDYWKTTPTILSDIVIPQFFFQVLEHKDIGFGVNYWLSPNAVFKLSYHAVEGNRFAYPDDRLEIAQVLATDMLEDETELVVFGVQFSF